VEPDRGRPCRRAGHRGGLLGLLVLGEQAAGSRPPLLRVLAAGALLGIAAGIKVNYLLLALGLAWALRRCPARLAIAAGASLAVLVPSYAWFGWPALRALAERRNSGSADSFYGVFLPHIMRGHLALIATVLVVALAGSPCGGCPPGCRSGLPSVPRSR
jgi:hypothetical protein